MRLRVRWHYEFEQRSPLLGGRRVAAAAATTTTTRSAARKGRWRWCWYTVRYVDLSHGQVSELLRGFGRPCGCVTCMRCPVLVLGGSCTVTLCPFGACTTICCLPKGARSLVASPAAGHKESILPSPDTRRDREHDHSHPAKCAFRSPGARALGKSTRGVLGKHCEGACTRQYLCTSVQLRMNLNSV